MAKKEDIWLVTIQFELDVSRYQEAPEDIIHALQCDRAFLEQALFEDLEGSFYVTVSRKEQ